MIYFMQFFSQIRRNSRSAVCCGPIMSGEMPSLLVAQIHVYLYSAKSSDVKRHSVVLELLTGGDLRRFIGLPVVVAKVKSLLDHFLVLLRSVAIAMFSIVVDRDQRHCELNLIRACSLSSLSSLFKERSPRGFSGILDAPRT